MPVPYLLKRLLHAALVLIIVSIIAFFLVRLAPGGPALLADPNLGSAERLAIEERLGINDPLPVQFAKWLAQLTRGELGTSFLYGMPVTQIILSRLPNTLLLAGTSLVVTVLVAIPLGMLCGLRPNGWLDRTISALSVVFLAVPVFWLGLLLIILFAVTLRVLPAGGMHTTGLEGNLPDLARHMLLPVLVLSTASIAEVLRYTRSSTRSVSRQDYVRTARAKGLSEFTVQSRHTLKNALIPVLTVLGLQLPRLIGGAAVTETIFSWPGMGRLSVEAALGRDYPLMTAITLCVALAVVLFNLLIDMLYPLIDPRIKAEA